MVWEVNVWFDLSHFSNMPISKSSKLTEDFVRVIDMEW